MIMAQQPQRQQRREQELHNLNDSSLPVGSIFPTTPHSTARIPAMSSSASPASSLLLANSNNNNNMYYGNATVQQPLNQALPQIMAAAYPGNTTATRTTTAWSNNDNDISVRNHPPINTVVPPLSTMLNANRMLGVSSSTLSSPQQQMLMAATNEDLVGSRTSTTRMNVNNIRLLRAQHQQQQQQQCLPSFFLPPTKLTASPFGAANTNASTTPLFGTPLSPRTGAPLSAAIMSGSLYPTSLSASGVPIPQSPRDLLCQSGTNSNIVRQESEDEPQDDAAVCLLDPRVHLSKPSFPEKIHSMLLQVQREGKDHIVSFVDDGQAFLIHKPRLFEADIMPLYFSSTRLSSFQRQLNIYGFVRVTEGPFKGSYRHLHFAETASPEQLAKIQRQPRGVAAAPVSGRSTAAAAAMPQDKAGA